MDPILTFVEVEDLTDGDLITWGHKTRAYPFFHAQRDRVYFHSNGYDLIRRTPCELPPMDSCAIRDDEHLWKVTFPEDWNASDADFADEEILSRARGNLVGFSGKAGSGKSVCSEAMTSLGFELVKFADPLKIMLRAYYSYCGLSEEEIEQRIEGSLKEKPDPFLNGRSPRHAMQTLGGDWGRDLIDKELWTTAWRNRALNMLNAGRNVVVDDLRYANEEKAIRDLGGMTCLVTRPVTKDVPSHSSEEHVIDADEVVENTGTVEDLRRRILSLAS